MTQRTLPLSTVIDVTTRIAVGGVPSKTFGLGLLLTTDDGLAAGGSGKVRLFEDLAGVTDALGSGGVADDAAVWFGADPAPKNLYIGRWASSDVSTTLRGGVAPDAADFTTSTGSISLNGNDITGIDVSAASITLAQVATAVQSAIQGTTGYAGATFAYDTDRFLLTLADGSPITGGALQAAATGTDLTGFLGMNDSSDPTYLQGHDAEAVGDALAEIVGLATAGSPVAIMLASDIADTVGGVDVRDAVSAYAQAGDHVFALLDTTDAALVTDDTTSALASAYGNGRSHVAPVYSVSGEKPDIGLLALMSGQNLSSPASIITPHGKAITGVQPSYLTSTQLAELTRKRSNVYTSVAGLPALLGGYTAAAGNWLDAVWWVLWAKNEIELAAWNAMRGSRRLTNAILRDSLGQVMTKGVRNGGIKPGGQASAATKADVIAVTGDENFDGVMSAGYIIWIDRTPTDVDRENRIGRFKIWCVGSEAIHKVMGDLVFQG